MWLTQAAWNNVDTTTIQNCWQKAHILPGTISSSPIQPTLLISSLIHPTGAMNNSDHIAHAKMLVKKALDDLEVTGAL
ncbi:hypothetical protein JVU11DRAFT_7839 [Chiua virens]|nr:hypothetical protein JVU11DRAFT_7839 [Chiua virens]